MNKLAAAVLTTTLATGAMVTVTPDAHAATSLRIKAMNTAASQKGKPYGKGGIGPNYYDCSGLTFSSYKKHKKTLPRTAQAQYNKATKVSAANRKPGDLIFIGKSSKGIYHVGIYAGVSKGYGYMWDAPKPGRTVGKHKIQNYTDGSPKAYYGRISG